MKARAIATLSDAYGCRSQADGIVSGSFMDTEGQLSQVTGGMKGEKIWLLIGNGARIQNHYFNGTLVDGKLLATAPGNGLRTWTLEGKPAKL
jgi:hypothetical protein